MRDRASLGHPAPATTPVGRFPWGLAPGGQVRKGGALPLPSPTPLPYPAAEAEGGTHAPPADPLRLIGRT
jgi:hypothetical protein